MLSVLPFELLLPFYDRDQFSKHWKNTETLALHNPKGKISNGNLVYFDKQR
jgi:hypothetical protein